MNPLLLNFANLLLCVAWAAATVYRLDAMHRHVPRAVGVLYASLFVAAVFSGLQFYIFGTLAGWPDLIVSAVVCALLWLGAPAWRNVYGRAPTEIG